MIIRFEDFTIDTERFELRIGDAPVEIEPQTLELLIFLAQSGGRLVTKDELHQVFWQGRFVSDAALSSLVRDARRAIGDSGKEQRVIETLHGRGFRFRAKVQSTDTIKSSASAVETAASPRLGPQAAPAVAVLPFTNFTGDPENDVLVDGITEEIITGLSRFRWFTVIARNSVFAYRGRPVDLRNVGAELGVDYLVEGSVIREADRVRVHVQLISAESGQHLWAERYNLTYDSLFSLLDEITTLLVGALQPELIDAERQRAERTMPRSRTPWQLFVQAQNLLAAPDRHSNALARAMLHEAAILEPDSARVQAGIALTHLWDIVFSWNSDAAKSLSEAFQAASRAVALGQSDSWAWSALGACKMTMRDHVGARSDHERAIEADPNSALAEGCLALTLAFSGDLEEALVAAARAERLSPNDRRSAIWQNARGIAEYGLGRFERALAAGRQVVAGRPDYVSGHRLVAASSARLGDHTTAQASVQAILRLKPKHSVTEEVSRLPFRDLRQAQAYADGLRAAGLA